MTTPNTIAAGQGPGLLFIHGAGGNVASWDAQFRAFTATHRVIAYDLPGFGRSAPPDPAHFTAHFAAAAAAALDSAGVARATVVGQSLGGWSALRLALAHPERVERLVLCCTMAGIAHPPALAAFAAAREQMGSRGPAALALPEAFRTDQPAAAALYDLITAANPPLDPALGALAFAPETLIPVARLADIRCPVLLLAAEHDAIWPPASLMGLVPAFRDARLHIFAGSGHSPYFERPAAFNAVLADFLAA